MPTHFRKHEIKTLRKYRQSEGYVYAVCPEHPYAAKDGRVLIHRLIVENSIGRYLTTDEIVHHKDGNKINNAVRNLEIVSKTEHREKHRKPITTVKQYCDSCGGVFVLKKGQDKAAKRYKHTFCSRDCCYAFQSHTVRRLRKHGDYNTYRSGCRCSRCKAANAARMRDLRANKKLHV